jgi:S-adenosylmethionine:tRNA ribosyltransferase-isomerase
MNDLALATTPPELRHGRRSAVRMLLSCDNELRDLEFESVHTLLKSADVLVFNLSATLPAEVLYGGVRVRYYDFHDTWCRFSATADPPQDVLGSHGLRPLGNSTVGYQSRRDIWGHLFEKGRVVADMQRTYPFEYYRSAFSVTPGSAEFPSAARPFTLEVVRNLMRSCVKFAYVTLHTGTHIESESPVPEYFMIPHDTLRLVERAKEAGHTVLAVGTSCVRALESVDRGVHTGRGVEGYTDLVISRAHRLKVVDGLITGFHDPDSSHFELLRAFRSQESLSDLYRKARSLGYRKGVFGDVCMLV